MKNIESTGSGKKKTGPEGIERECRPHGGSGRTLAFSNPNPGAIFVPEKPLLCKHGPTVLFQRSKVGKKGSSPALEGFSVLYACVSHGG